MAKLRALRAHSRIFLLMLFASGAIGCGEQKLSYKTPQVAPAAPPGSIYQPKSTVAESNAARTAPNAAAIEIPVAVPEIVVNNEGITPVTIPAIEIDEGSGKIVYSGTFRITGKEYVGQCRVEFFGGRANGTELPGPASAISIDSSTGKYSVPIEIPNSKGGWVCKYVEIRLTVADYEWKPGLTPPKAKSVVVAKGELTIRGPVPAKDIAPGGGTESSSPAATNTPPMEKPLMSKPTMAKPPTGE